MSRIVVLREIAHARAGDKGNRSNVSVFANSPEHYPTIVRQVTASRIKKAFPGLILGKITRYEIPGLNAINLVMDDALEGGVNTSLNLDGHGKSWSYLILGLKVEIFA